MTSVTTRAIPPPSPQNVPDDQGIEDNQTRPGVDLTERKVQAASNAAEAEQQRVASGQRPRRSIATIEGKSGAAAPPTLPTLDWPNPSVTRMANEITATLPDMRRYAAHMIQADMKAKWGLDVDADNTFLVTFDYNTRGRGTHEATIVRKISLTDALIRNIQGIKSDSRIPVPWRRAGPDVTIKDEIAISVGDFGSKVRGPAGESSLYTNRYTGIYRGNADGSIGPRLTRDAQLGVPRDEFQKAIWDRDFSATYKNVLNAFWSSHREMFQATVKAAFAKAAIRQHAERSLDDGGFDLARRLTQLPPDKPWTALTEKDFAKPLTADPSIEAGLLDVHGYKSTDLMYVTDRNSGRTLLHVPGNSSPIHTFANQAAMKKWFAEQCASYDTRAALSCHFPDSSKADGYLRAGIDTALPGLGAWPASYSPRSNDSSGIYAHKNFSGQWDPENYITTSRHADPFHALATRSENRSRDDANTDITSHRDYYKKMGLRAIDHVNRALLPIALVFPEFAGVGFGLAGVAEAGIGLDDIRHGKPGGVAHAVFGLLNALPIVAGKVAEAARGAEEAVGATTGSVEHPAGTGLPTATTDAPTDPNKVVETSEGSGIYTLPGRDGSYVQINGKWHRSKPGPRANSVVVVDTDQPDAFRNPTYATRETDGTWRVRGKGGLQGGEDGAATVGKPNAPSGEPGISGPSTQASKPPPPIDKALVSRTVRPDAVADANGIYAIDGKTYVKLDGYQRTVAEVARTEDGKLALVTRDRGEPVGPRLRQKPGGTTYEVDMAPVGDAAAPSADGSSRRFELGAEDAAAYERYQDQLANGDSLGRKDQAQMEAIEEEAEARGNALIEDAYKRLPTSRVRRPPPPVIPGNATDAEVTEGLLKDASGLIVGENHNLPQARSFLISNMDELAKQGVDTLYVELPVELYGASVDTFNKTGEVDDLLAEIGDYDDNPVGLLDVMKKAREHRITIVPTDTVVASDLGRNGASQSPLRRISSYNMHATDVIRTHQARPGAGKFAALVGHKHADTTRAGGITVPGLADTTGARSLSLDGWSPASGTERTGYADMQLGPKPRPANVDPKELVADGDGFYKLAPDKTFVKIGDAWYHALRKPGSRIAVLIDAGHANTVNHNTYAVRDEIGHWVIQQAPGASRQREPAKPERARQEIARIADMKPRDTRAVVRNETYAIAMDGLSSRSNASTLPLITSYIKSDAGKINRLLRRPGDPKVLGDTKKIRRKTAKEQFMRQFNQLNNYYGSSYRTTRVTEKAADKLLAGKDLVFTDRGVQSASIVPFNLQPRKDERQDIRGKAKSRLSAVGPSAKGTQDKDGKATIPAVFVFDATVPQKNLSTDAQPDHVAVPPGTRLRVVASRKKGGIVYVYLTAAAATSTVPVIDLAKGSRSMQGERKRWRPSMAR